MDEEIIKMKNQQEILLNVKQFEELAKEQSDVLNDLQIMQNLIYYMPETGNFIVDEQLDLIHSKLQQMVKSLDATTAILYSTADKRDLEEFGIEIIED